MISDVTVPPNPLAPSLLLSTGPRFRVRCCMFRVVHAEWCWCWCWVDTKPKHVRWVNTGDGGGPEVVFVRRGVQGFFFSLRFLCCRPGETAGFVAAVRFCRRPGWLSCVVYLFFMWGVENRAEFRALSCGRLL